MLQLKDYVASFVHVYRSQADKLQEPEKAVFGGYAEEETLRKPCQVEIVEFRDPYRLVWVFFFDKAKPDLKMSSYRVHWKNLGVLVAEFGTKYRELQLDLTRIYRIFEHFHEINVDDLSYSMNVLENAYFLCFPADPRLGVWPLSRVLQGDSKPQQVAETIFHLNYSQAQDRFL